MGFHLLGHALQTLVIGGNFRFPFVNDFFHGFEKNARQDKK
jgi:hypothetical protein